MAQSTDKVIFRREFNRNVADKSDSFFIQLESEESDSPLATVQPLAVSIAEAFSFATPIVTVTFNDGNGAYFNMIKMDTEQKYYLDMGGTKFKSTRIPLKISKIQLKNMVGGKSTQVTFKITFVHSGWSELLNIRHNRSFTKQPYTSTVKTIMGEVGYKSVSVSESSGNFDQIQPHWSNLLFLKWIQDRAISKSGEHFEFGCNIDGEFFFKTIGDIVKDKKSDIIAKKIPTMHMGSYNENEIKREKDLTDNFNVPNFFTDFSSTSFYLDGVVNGSGGVQSFNYDYDSGSFITKNHTLSDSSITQLSDFLSIKTSHEVSKMRIYGGSESGEAIAKSVLSSVALSNEEFRITTDGSINIHIGMIIELLIQNDPNIYRSPYSELHSGFYVVASVNHVVSLGDGNKFVSVVHLARTGFNSKKAIGYAKTKSGKAV
jgi:hypothetical protein